MANHWMLDSFFKICDVFTGTGRRVHFDKLVHNIVCY